MSSRRISKPKNYRCIYCRLSKPSSEFKPEHILPRYLGNFPVYRLLDLVCSECNNKISNIERKFKEGSIEGLLSSFYELRDHGCATVSKKTLLWEIKINDKAIAQNIPLPVLIGQNNAIGPTEDLLIFEGNDFINYFKADYLEKLLKLKNAEYKSVSKKIQSIKSDKLKFFGTMPFSKRDINGLLKAYGVERELQSKAESIIHEPKPDYGTIEIIFGNSAYHAQFFAKVALEYYVFKMALVFPHKVHSTELLPIIDFILNAKGLDYTEDEVKRFLFIDKPLQLETNKRLPHKIRLFRDREGVKVQMNLFGIRVVTVTVCSNEPLSRVLSLPGKALFDYETIHSSTSFDFETGIVTES